MVLPVPLLIGACLQGPRIMLGTAHSAFRPVGHLAEPQPAAMLSTPSTQRDSRQGRGAEQVQNGHRHLVDSVGQDVAAAFQAAAELGVRQSVLQRAAGRLQDLGMTGGELQLAL